MYMRLCYFCEHFQPPRQVEWSPSQIAVSGFFFCVKLALCSWLAFVMVCRGGPPAECEEGISQFAIVQMSLPFHGAIHPPNVTEKNASLDTMIPPPLLHVVAFRLLVMVTLSAALVSLAFGKLPGCVLPIMDRPLVGDSPVSANAGKPHATLQSSWRLGAGLPFPLSLEISTVDPVPPLWRT